MNALSNAIAGTKQFVSMGALPWFGGVAVAALLLGAWGSFVVTKRFTEGRALRAEKALLAFEAQLSEQTSIAEREAARRQVEAMQAITASNDAITALIDGIGPRVDRIVAKRVNELRSYISGPEYDCLRTPLPDPFLDGLRQPGGNATAQNSRSPRVPATAGSVFTPAANPGTIRSVGTGSY